MKEIEKRLNELVDFGLLTKNKKGYIYPKWLWPYCKDKKLMKGIIGILKTPEKQIKDLKKSQNFLMKDGIKLMKKNRELREEIKKWKRKKQ